MVRITFAFQRIKADIRRKMQGGSRFLSGKWVVAHYHS